MSLRTRLLILVIAAMLVPASLVGLRFVQNRSSEVNAALANLAASADDIASDLGGKIQGTAQLHYGLARARDLDTRDKAACSAFLSDVREEYPQFTGILTIDPDGSLFCDSLRTNRTLDLRDRAYFKQALVSRNVVVEPVFGRLTGISVLQIAYPVRSEAGALKLVLLASFNLRKFAEYHHKRLLAEKDILLIDGKGTVLVAPSGAGWTAPVGASIAGSDLLGFATAPDQKAFQEVTDRDGRTQVWAVAHSPSIRDAGLYILVGRSKDGLVAAANRRLYEDMAILAVALLLLLAGVWILATVSVGRQVGRLANMAKRLGLGDLSARIPPPHPRGELGGLMTLLNGTAESLEQQRAAIADLNQKLSQSQKMEAMGQLTGGVAHDFNNLLTVILGNSEHLADRLAGNKELHRIAGDIATAAERGSDLTRSLLAFARKQPLRPRDIDIGEKIKEVEHLLRRPLGEHIECTFALAPDLWLISVDPGQLTTALLNLVLNARDVMQLGGRLTIEARNVSLGESDLDINGERRPGDYVMVAVIDTGSGMTAEVASRAFEPFFTTKEVGKGTGLGLSMVYGFVRQSGGLVQMQSAPRQGSTVRLFFPRLATPPNEDASPAEGIVTREGSETILVVEDNDMVRTYVESELKTLGYRVITAASGPAALDLLRQSGDIDLLFTDVVMPGGMFGPELARQAIQLRPGLKVLFTSGYSQNPVSAPDAIGDARILTKPFRRRDLAAMLRSALSTPSR
ncbi:MULTISPECIES: ATP-binding protein [Bradyrhizobium]|uniref:histidine kinase n=1 Tax=Bradyrhizobium canariense TaxID=255045 RepID=A0A1X3FNT0_9BRAD|nr:MULTISPECIES: ATP-binding protein [Bradyrhizobium]OSI68305.1 hybrid sensor histidine kinase/response regulator [Bradyrhizobium canariense]OSI68403.1 hybrid sensor histidine kinase/response regulator [Bradyrhizobium canariense]OSI79948.1 hybrid sensor histidine kinase/response regulator [Bradyrhizobium canariense]OSI91554.1 hybrid sensor histidine kinase/response regulator [Bradyrhizobium canariense]OSI92632.1 hybrid sensor histidine kinase/response regulator [Bradyrhizobium canariense]